MILMIELELNDIHAQTALLLQNTVNITSVAGYIRNLFLKSNIDIKQMHSFSYAINKVRHESNAHMRYVRYQKDSGHSDTRSGIAAPTIDRQHFNTDITLYIDMKNYIEDKKELIFDILKTLKLQGGHNRKEPILKYFDTLDNAILASKTGLMVSLRNETFSNNVDADNYFEKVMHRYFSGDKDCEAGIFGLMHTHYVVLNHIETYAKNGKDFDFFNRIGKKGLYVCEAGFSIVEYLPIKRTLHNHQFNYNYDTDAFYIENVSSQLFNNDDDDLEF